MTRFRLGAVIATAVLLTTTAHQLSAQVQVGGGLGFLFDQTTDFIVLGGQARLPIGHTNWVFSPRAETFIGLSTFQVDADLLYNIQTSGNGMLKPYAGIGGGISRFSDEDFSETKPVMNLIAGTRIVPKNSRLEFYFESHYSSGINYTNNEVLYGGILFRVGGH